MLENAVRVPFYEHFILEYEMTKEPVIVCRQVCCTFTGSLNCFCLFIQKLRALGPKQQEGLSLSVRTIVLWSMDFEVVRVGSRLEARVL